MSGTAGDCARASRPWCPAAPPGQAQQRPPARAPLPAGPAALVGGSPHGPCWRRRRPSSPGTRSPGPSTPGSWPVGAGRRAGLARGGRRRRGRRRRTAPGGSYAGRGRAGRAVRGTGSCGTWSSAGCGTADRGGAVPAHPAGGDRPGHLRRTGDGVALVRLHRRRRPDRPVLARAAAAALVAPPLPPAWACSPLTLRPLARRQRGVPRRRRGARRPTRLASAPGLRDITAAGAEDRIAADTGARSRSTQCAAAVPRPLAASCGWLALAIGGQLPIVLLLVDRPWLLAHGVTAGALLGALDLCHPVPAARPCTTWSTAWARAAPGWRSSCEDSRRTCPAADDTRPVGRPPPGHAHLHRLRAPRPSGRSPSHSRSVTFAYGPAARPVSTTST